MSFINYCPKAYLWPIVRAEFYLYEYGVELLRGINRVSTTAYDGIAVGEWINPQSERGDG